MVFVDPNNPTPVELPDFPEIPFRPIEITEEPKFGQIIIDKNFKITYQTYLADKTSTVLDKASFKYTNLLGKTVVVRKQFILEQKGDLPKIIQTGRSTSSACTPVKPQGQTIGNISVGNVSLPIKSFIYAANGIMEPTKSTLMAAASLRHMPLSSTLGTSVIVWHTDYSGCLNKLNVITTKAVGSTFNVTDEKGKTLTYKIAKKYVVARGDYQESWFNWIGPRQLLLVTCAGPFVNGHYQENFVAIAVPV